ADAADRLDQQLAHALTAGELVPGLARGPQRRRERGELLPVVLTDRLGAGLQQPVAAHQYRVADALDGAEFLVEQPAQAVGVCVLHGQFPSSCAASCPAGVWEVSSLRPRRVPSAHAAAIAGRPGPAAGGSADVLRGTAGALERLRTVSPLAVLAGGSAAGPAPSPDVAAVAGRSVAPATAPAAAGEEEPATACEAESTAPCAPEPGASGEAEREADAAGAAGAGEVSRCFGRTSMARVPW